MNRTAHPEPVFRARVREVNDEFKGLVVEGFERQQYMIDQQVSIDLSHPAQHTRYKASINIISSAQYETLSKRVYQFLYETHRE